MDTKTMIAIFHEDNIVSASEVLPLSTNLGVACVYLGLYLTRWSGETTADSWGHARTPYHVFRPASCHPILGKQVGTAGMLPLEISWGKTPHKVSIY